MFYHLNRLQMTPKSEQAFQHVHSQHVKQLRTIYFRGKYSFFFAAHSGSFSFHLITLGEPEQVKFIHHFRYGRLFSTHLPPLETLRQLPMFVDGNESIHFNTNNYEVDH